MKINNKHYRTIWIDGKNRVIFTFDQRLLPHQIKLVKIKSSNEAAAAISDMLVRGAPLIGAMAAYGLYLATLESKHGFEKHLSKQYDLLSETRPTAINLIWALNKVRNAINREKTIRAKQEAALMEANTIVEQDVAVCSKIGEYGLELIQNIAKTKKNGKPVNILTHCNAGWLACIDWGTATAPIYQAQQKNIPVHVWVDETRPRLQGGNLTAFEFNQQGISHTLVVDNAGGHLMQHGMVDMVIVGTDRTTANGDVANKIGTYLKALAAKDNDVPFYVALPSSSIDWTINDGVKEIPIEERSEDEVRYIYGKAEGKIDKVLICPETTPVANYGFDVTPAHLITGLITEHGVCKATQKDLLALFSEIE